MYYNDELYHHGRLFQRWGVRNGPPYPLSRSAVKKAYGKKGGRQLSEEERAANHEAEKQRVLREGSATEVLQYAGEISNQELSNALNRIKWTNELSKYAQEEAEKGWRNANRVMKKVGDVKDWTKIGVDLWRNIDDAISLAEKAQKRSDTKAGK